nr:hypothetical protein [Enterobacter hormaechei]
MKLIDILVRDLPGLGGWPKDKTVASHGPNNCVMFHELGVTPFVYAGLKFEGNDIVTKEEYEAAIAASKPEWNGEGVPPVGTESEYSLNAGRTWFKCKIDYVLGTQGLIMLADVYEGGQFVGFAEYDGKLKFRPIRSEADKKRDEAAKGLIEYLDTEADIDNVFSIKDVIGFYDAIAAGKIPHIRID